MPTDARPNTRMQSDRFAREIVGILVLSYAARSRRLMRNPLGRALLYHLDDTPDVFAVMICPCRGISNYEP